MNYKSRNVFKQWQKPTLQKPLDIVFLFVRPFSFQHSVLKQVPVVIDIPHDTERCWSYPHFVPNPSHVDYLHRKLICGLPRYFGSHRHHFLFVFLVLCRFLSRVAMNREPQWYWTTLQFSNAAEATKLTQHHVEKSLTNSLRISELTRQALKTLLQLRCWKVSTTFQTIAKSAVSALFEQRSIIVQISKNIHFTHGESLQRNSFG